MTKSFPLQARVLFWIAPILVMLFAFRVLPIFEAFRLSFTDASVVASGAEFVGFDTLSRVVFTRTFVGILRSTFVFVFACIILQLGLGMGLALLINGGLRRNVRGSLFVRGTVLLSWIVPGIVIGVIWSMILMEARYGLANYLLQMVGIQPIRFLSQATPAMISIVVANTWRGTAFSMIIQFAALQKIPEQLYEAAQIDGSSKLQEFLYVTLPSLRTMIFVNLVLITIATFNLFDFILPLTGGGPGRATEVLALNLYRRAFTQFDLAGASAVAVVLLLINVVITLVYYRLLATEED